VTVENQAAANDRIPKLQQTPAAIRFLSCEPLLEPIRLPDLTGIDWVIVGGESGPGARPCAIEWIEGIVEQCQSAGVSVFVKQVGALPMFGGKRYSVSDRKGGKMEEWPRSIQIRQMPTQTLNTTQTET
jgi:protein gp37